MPRLTNLATASSRLGIPRETLVALKSRGLIHPIIVGGVDYVDERQHFRLQTISKGHTLGFSIAELDYLLTWGKTSITTNASPPSMTTDALLDRILSLDPGNKQIVDIAAELRSLLSRAR